LKDQTPSPSPFLFFSNAERKRIKAEEGEVEFVDMSRRLGDAWKHADHEDWTQKWAENVLEIIYARAEDRERNKNRAAHTLASANEHDE